MIAFSAVAGLLTSFWVFVSFSVNKDVGVWKVELFLWEVVGFFGGERGWFGLHFMCDISTVRPEWQSAVPEGLGNAAAALSERKQSCKRKAGYGIAYR